jgi:hypothetical protein
MGIVLGKHFQLDVAGSWGKYVEEYVASVVYQF